MDIQAEKIALIRWLTQVNDMDIIAKIKALQNEKVDWLDEMSPEERADLDEGLKDLKEGRKRDFETVMKKYIDPSDAH